MVGQKSLLYRARRRVAQRVSPLHEATSASVVLEPILEPQHGYLLREDLTVTPTDSFEYSLLTNPKRRAFSLLEPSVSTRDILFNQTPHTGRIPLHEFLFPSVSSARMPVVDSNRLIRIPKPSTRKIRPDKFAFLTTNSARLSLLDTTEVFGIQPTLSTPLTADSVAFLEDPPKVSPDLFRPLLGSKSNGKNYRNELVDGLIIHRNPSLAPDRDTRPSGYKCSYRERRRQDGIVTRQGLSIWDLIFPLLQPPPFDVVNQKSVFIPKELEPHQPAGVTFLATQSSALLGDGVQTGKTIQAIVAMKVLFQCGKIRSALVICPISVLKHWQDRLCEWAPELWPGLTVVRSPNREKREIMWSMPVHIHVTNYETLVSDIDTVIRYRGRKGYDLIVADEIQRIKNPNTETAKAVKKLGALATYRWGLSATPIENSLDDLVSIFDFLRPGLLKHHCESETSASSKIKPYFLRRRTQDIAKSFKLPRYDEYRVEMEGRQLEAYESAYEESVAELRRLGEEVTLAHALAKLQALKQLCNVHLASKESAKMDFLVDWLEDIIASGNKVLVFSQYREFGMDFIADQLERFGCIHYGRATSDSAKQAAVQAFREDETKCVFVANPATAGTGLPDLKVANYVVHFDHWWNPAREDQASGRVLGIGQKKDVFIAHVWVENSIEGRIEDILAEKRELFGRVIDSQSSPGGTGLSTEELFGLFGLDVPERLRSQKSK